MSHALGLRVTELATITIRDALHVSGRIRSELTMRNLPLSNELLLHHLELYLAYRIEQDIGVLPAKSEDYRGLSPDLTLVFSSRGGGFAMATKKRVLESGVYMEYKACDALEQLFRHLYKISGMKGASSHSGRRSYASRLVESGVDIEDVSRLLGHSDLDYTLIYVSPSKEAIYEAFELAL
jgi:integrase